MPRRPTASRLGLRGSHPGWVAVAILVAVCAVSAHQATYLFGYRGDALGEAMGTGGHDGYWGPLVALVVLAAAALAVVAIRELRRLSAHARHLDSDGHPDGERRAFVWSVGALWLRLGLATTVVYAVQENVERVLVGGVPTGLDALAAHGLLPVMVIAATSCLVATVAALVRWRCQVLRARLARAATVPPRGRAQRTGRPASARVPHHVIRDAYGSRAPPLGSIAG